MQSRSISLTGNYKQFDKKIHRGGNKLCQRKQHSPAKFPIISSYEKYTSGAGQEVKGNQEFTDVDVFELNYFTCDWYHYKAISRLGWYMN